jgi:15-cis-phytoene desaturase
MNKNYDVIIVGAGLSGLTCAIELAEQKRKVLVLEKQEYFGGRTASWTEDGMPVESALHKFLGFYSELPKLIEKTGTNLDDIVVWEDEMEIITPEGQRAVFGASPLGKPWETIATALGNNDFLPAEDKASFVKFLTFGLKDYFTDPEKLDEMSVTEYGEKLGISKIAMERIIRALSEGILMWPMEQSSTLAFAALMGPYLHKSIRFGIGTFNGGMSDVLIEPIIKHAKKLGVEIRNNAEVEGLVVEEGSVNGVVCKGETIEATVTVLATTAFVAQNFLTDALPDEAWVKHFQKLPTMSTVSLQIELDTPSLPTDRVNFGAGTSLVVFAEQSRTTFSQSEGRLSIVFNNGSKLIEWSDEKIYELAVADGKKLGIDIAQHCKEYRVIRHPDEFYQPSPGANQYRPTQETPTPGLVLTGDYTEQPNPSTMEGAVVSGLRAAEVVLK